MITHREMQRCKICVPVQKSLPSRNIFQHILIEVILDYHRLGSSKRMSLKYLKLSIHTFKEVSRQSLGSLCPRVVYSDRMIDFHYQINFFPKEVAKLVNDKFS